MERSVLIGGFGGQGVMLIGKLLGYAALEQGMDAVFFPAYGAEQRGGTANCTLIISEEEIECPLREQFDTLIIMNQLSYVRFGKALKEGGNMIINSALVHISEEDGVSYIPVDCGGIATQLGNVKAANMVALGAYMAITGGHNVEKVKDVLRRTMANRPKLLELNLKAIDAGMALFA